VLLSRTGSDVAGLEIAIHSRPARQISGDLYDFEPNDNNTVIAFGDVSGKGAAAALFGALISGLLRTLAPRRRSPIQLMKSMNEALLERKVDAQYATLLLISWNPPAKTFKIANAGSLPPLLCRNGEVTQCLVEGVPIGLLEDQEYDEMELEVQSDDLLVLYSDGVEDQLSGDEDYGRDRLVRLLSLMYREPPEKIVAAIFDDIDVFRGANALTDDQTVIVLKIQ
jgi:sigma-B regulation protein RsbU (phosphoserine phosphatase)